MLSSLGHDSILVFHWKEYSKVFIFRNDNLKENDLVQILLSLFRHRLQLVISFFVLLPPPPKTGYTVSKVVRYMKTSIVIFQYLHVYCHVVGCDLSETVKDPFLIFFSFFLTELGIHILKVHSVEENLQSIQVKH